VDWSASIEPGKSVDSKTNVRGLRIRKSLPVNLGDEPVNHYGTGNYDWHELIDEAMREGNRGGGMDYAAELHRRCTGVTRARTVGNGVRQINSGKLAMHAMAVEFPLVLGHPNRLPFEGILTLVDVASDKAPSGARGHRVVLTRAAAEAALPSLLGMAVDYKAGWDGHDARQKCGIITSAELDGRHLTVAGFVFCRDFPEIEQRLGIEGSMGMSYELAEAHVVDMQAQVWTLTRATFTGAAILLREKAAYRGTSFRLGRVPASERAAALRVASSRR
jgi:hypothetical protein